MTRERRITKSWTGDVIAFDELREMVETFNADRFEKEIIKAFVQVGYRASTDRSGSTVTLTMISREDNK